MKRPFNTSFLTVLVALWCVGSSGCSRTQLVTPAAPPQAAMLSEDRSLPPPIEAPIDVETFTAFCDRA